MATPSQTWDEFEKELQSYGNRVRKEFTAKLNDEIKIGQAITPNKLQEIIIGVANDPKHISKLQLASDAIIGHHNPRANDPRVTQKVEAGNRRQGPDVQLKLPSWAAGFDGISLPPNPSADNKKGVLNQFDNVMNKLETHLRNQHKLKQRLAPAPMPSRPAPKPDRH